LVRLLFLGKFGDAAPADLRDIVLPIEVRTLTDLKEWVARQAPTLGQAIAASHTRVVLNQTVAHDMSATVRDGDEIAFLPPMSGG
jgi:molybdopterin converting factor small subunit